MGEEYGGVVNKTADNLILEEKDPDIHGRDRWALSADMDGQTGSTHTYHCALKGSHTSPIDSINIPNTFLC